MFLFPQLILSNKEAFIELFGLRYFFSDAFSPTQLVTYALIHASWSHLFSNMFALIIFGPILEMTLGARRFLLFYFWTAVGAGLIYSVIHFFEVYPFIEVAKQFLASPNPDGFAEVLTKMGSITYQEYLVIVDDYARNPLDPQKQYMAIKIVENLVQARINTPMVGASGAVFGIMMGFGYLYPNLQLMLLFPPIPVRAKYLVGFYGVIALYSAIERVPGDNVAHFAHLGGMLVGYLLIKYWRISAVY